MKKINIGLWLVVGSWLLLTTNNLLLTNNSYAQFTTDRDTLFIASGDSTTSYVVTNSDTLACYDLNGKLLVGVNFDTTSAFTADKFFIQHSSTYDASADTAGGSPCNWATVTYEGDIYYFTKETGDNILKPQVVYGLKRYIRFGAVDSSGDWVNEAADRKLVPLIRPGF